MSYFRLIGLIAFFALGANALGYVAPYYDLENAEQHFADFVKKYERQYESAEEFSKRFEIFKANLIKINQLNGRYKHKNGGYEITQFSDQASYRSCYRPSKRINATMIEVKREFIVNAPDHLDYREQNLVTEVKNQGLCGSCYVFSAVGNIEGMYAKKTGNLISLSEQQGLDCCTGNCEAGGTPFDVIMGLANEGCESEKDYPYVAEQKTCSTDQSKIKVRVNEPRHCVTPDTESMRDELISNGAPLSIAFFVPPSMLHVKGKQILNPDDCHNYEFANHAALLVGYSKDPETGKPYWIIKNSWGTSVGDNGYFYLDFENRCSFSRFETVTCTIE